MNRAKVTVICGPMFAGKSTELITRAERAERAERATAVCMIKYRGDTRYDAEVRDETPLVVSHDDLTHPAVSVSTLAEITDGMLADVAHVFVDEGQFFPDLLDFTQRVRALPGVQTLVISGLDYNHKREHFGQMHDVARIADVELRLTAICADCHGSHGPAVYTRMDVADESLRNAEIVVGGSETYTPVCAHCYHV
jgi:thymidine kinase